MLSAFDSVLKNEDAFIVSFKEVYSLPLVYIKKKASSLENRYRLKTPYLEYFSQGFGKYFSRVALPREIQRF